AEPVVQRPLGHPRALGDQVHADRGDPALVEQLLGGRHDAPAGRCQLLLPVHRASLHRSVYSGGVYRSVYVRGGRTMTATDTMRAVRITEHGGAEVLELADVPVPAPQPDEALVRLGAAALDRKSTRL